ncbi:hypothetical protein LPJ56_000518 [Coemansia sp. RSA 2599]|nr:hypothetical protein LPJ75_000206 [Coemansia sp. RSA 2598]KAJ1829217.1 hypothetical protein LPJ56_000518 [Coemansia sp. RSA 2599]
MMFHKEQTRLEESNSRALPSTFNDDERQQTPLCPDPAQSSQISSIADASLDAGAAIASDTASNDDDDKDAPLASAPENENKTSSSSSSGGGESLQPSDISCLHISADQITAPLQNINSNNSNGTNGTNDKGQNSRQQAPRQKTYRCFSHVEISTPEQVLGDGWRERINGNPLTPPKLPQRLSVDDTRRSASPEAAAPSEAAGEPRPEHAAMAWALRLRRLGVAVKGSCVDRVVAAGEMKSAVELQAVLESMGLVLASSAVVSGVLSLPGAACRSSSSVVDATYADLVPLMLMFDRRLRGKPGKPGAPRGVKRKRVIEEVFRHASDLHKSPDLLVSVDPTVPAMLALALADQDNGIGVIDNDGGGDSFGSECGADAVEDEVFTVHAVREACKLWRSLLIPETQRRRSVRTRAKESVCYDVNAQFADLIDEDAEPTKKRPRAVKTPSRQKAEREPKKTRTTTSGVWASSGREFCDAYAKLDMLTEIDFRPTPLQIQRTPFVPLVFSSSQELPVFWMLEPVIKPFDPTMGSQLNMTSDRFALPMDFGLWMAAQQKLWHAWKAANPEVSAVRLSRIVQLSTCQKSFQQSMCRNCVSRQADQPCLYKGIRVAIELTFEMRHERESNAVTRLIYAPAFASAEPMPLRLRKVSFDPYMDPVGTLGMERQEVCTDQWAAFYCALHAAPLLIERLQRLLELAEDSPQIESVEYQAHPRIGCSSQPCVVRPPAPYSRQLCDACKGELFGLYYMCCCCVREICHSCLSSWPDDSAAIDDGRFFKEQQAAKAAPAVVNCCSTMKVLRGGTRHVRRQHMRFIHWPAEDLQRVADHAHAIMKKVAMLGRAVDAGGLRPLSDENARFWRRIEGLRRDTKSRYAYEPWDLAPLYVNDGDLTLAEFSRLWERGIVVVVRGLLDKLQARSWTPRYWIEQLGSEEVTILDCTRGSEPVGKGKWQLKEFFRLFDGPADPHRELFESTPFDEAAWAARKACVQAGIVKIKDWPPTESFAQRLPLHFERFMAALPFKQYTHPDGVLNMAARLTADCLPPDLGPKMYCAYGSSDAKGGYGTTNLHCDMADAVNIMAYAAGNRADQAAAVWDIFPDKNMPFVRQFLRDHTATGRRAEDVVHDQNTYLTQELRDRMYRLGETRASAYRVHQYPGDAVFVPAGCAHQVCNYANAVKIAVDFVSPERVRHCDALAAEFQRLAPPHPRSDDKLQLSSILWWAVADKDEIPREAVASAARPGRRREAAVARKVAASEREGSE